MNDMKILNKIVILMLVLLLAVACNENFIDPISKVEAGKDQGGPTVTVKYPLEGTMIQVGEMVTSMNIQVEVTDDIEINYISILIDGKEIKNVNGFKDYRRALIDFLQTGITNGKHVLTIKATDYAGKVTTKDINFEKKPPYVPIYDGEIFYMPFDGDYVEKVSFITATKVGNPGYAGSALKGLNAYAGATDGYLTFPTTALKNNTFSAAFWLKINAVPDRAGILVMGPPDTAAPTAPNNRKNGFRFFREAASGKQRFKLNVGNGTADTWVDGGTAADVDPASGKWVHFAFTISPSEAVVYIDGKVVKQSTITGVNWDGCDILSIMSGAPRFSGWNHLSDLSFMDELRIFNKALTQVEIQNIIQNDKPYVPKYSGEVFYMPFEGNYKDLVTNREATKVGSPLFATGKSGQAYAGATGAYLTVPAAGLQGSAVSAVFWMKINATPDRAGILTMGPPDIANPTAMNNRTSGFRFFRENAGGKQRFKLNAGNGTADTWVDGGTAADVDPTTGNWVHFGYTISGTECNVYINGEVVKQAAFGGISWTGCDILSIMSGAPRFTGWNHLSDLSLMDELRIFNKALTQTEIQTIMNAEK